MRAPVFLIFVFIFLWTTESIKLIQSPENLLVFGNFEAIKAILRNVRLPDAIHVYNLAALLSAKLYNFQLIWESIAFNEIQQNDLLTFCDQDLFWDNLLTFEVVIGNSILREKTPLYAPNYSGLYSGNGRRGTFGAELLAKFPDLNLFRWYLNGFRHFPFKVESDEWLHDWIQTSSEDHLRVIIEVLGPFIPLGCCQEMTSEDRLPQFVYEEEKYNKFKARLDFISSISQLFPSDPIVQSIRQMRFSDPVVHLETQTRLDISLFATLWEEAFASYLTQPLDSNSYNEYSVTKLTDLLLLALEEVGSHHSDIPDSLTDAIISFLQNVNPQQITTRTAASIIKRWSNVDFIDPADLPVFWRQDKYLPRDLQSDEGKLTALRHTIPLSKSIGSPNPEAIPFKVKQLMNAIKGSSYARLSWNTSTKTKVDLDGFKTDRMRFIVEHFLAMSFDPVTGLFQPIEGTNILTWRCSTLNPDHVSLFLKLLQYFAFLGIRFNMSAFPSTNDGFEVHLQQFSSADTSCHNAILHVFYDHLNFYMADPSEWSFLYSTLHDPSTLTYIPSFRK